MEEVNDEVNDFIPVVCFVSTGVSKTNPEKILLSADELKRIIKDTQNELDSENDGDTMETSSNEMGNCNDDEYNFENYDTEGGAQTAAIGSIVTVEEQEEIENEDDSDAEDDIIKPTDNLILVGHVQEDAVQMEVWVFNREEESLYVHHDFLLPHLPLCFEWLNHDSELEKPGNLCAIGSMDPIITLWDLDIQDSYEPAYKLGTKGSRKKNISKTGHTDAVLDLSWNRNFSHILASGSVDKTVILWDMDRRLPHTTISAFKEKVQTISFHSTEAQNLLVGTCDGIVKLYDCRDPSTVNSNFTKWKLNSEIEKVVWSLHNSNCFMTGTNNGYLHYIDIRNKTPVWSKEAHSQEISGICFNSQVENLLTTCSADGLVKFWKYDHSEAKEIYSHDFSIGRIQSVSQCPEDHFTFVFGGDKPKNGMRVYNIKNFVAVRRTFNLEEEET